MEASNEQVPEDHPTPEVMTALILLLVERIRELETEATHSHLQEMELFKAELLASVSHELRSPLASIKGYTATLLRHEHRLSREERHAFLLAISEASSRLEVVIDRLLELSQFETGSIQIEHSSVDVIPLVREAISVAEQRVKDVPSSDMFRFRLWLKNAQGELVSAEPLVKGDPRRVREIMDNLLDNAVKYSPEGGVIDIILRPVPQNQDGSPNRVTLQQATSSENAAAQFSTQESQRMLEICVCDHGLGIPPEHLRRIFDRFHRVDTRLTREVNGLGLGLTICQRIVELHDGLIWAESCPRGGSAFHVWLPVDEAEESEVLLESTKVS